MVYITDITLHIRAVGQWTNRLYDYFEHSQTMSLKDALKTMKNLPTSDGELSQISDSVCGSMETEFENLRTLQRENLEALVQAFTSLSKRTMILPIPEDCDENGCRRKTRKLKSNSGTEISDSDFEDIELLEIEKNKEENRPNEITFSLIEAYQNFTEEVHSNAVFLNKPLKIHLDGPYGAPSSNIFETEHAVLVATGIGVTPFASILQSIIYRHIEKKRNCPVCQHSWTEKVPSQRIMSLRKVDFMWINRDHSSFEWFVEKLASLKQQQISMYGENNEQHQFLDIHMYVTGKEAKYEDKNISIKKKYGDTLNWQSGRPDWHQLFTQLRKQNRGKVTVFYCGRPDLGTFLRSKCSEFNFSFKKEVF